MFSMNSIRTTAHEQKSHGIETITMNFLPYELDVIRHAIDFYIINLGNARNLVDPNTLYSREVFEIYDSRLRILQETQSQATELLTIFVEQRKQDQMPRALRNGNE